MISNWYYDQRRNHSGIRKTLGTKKKSMGKSVENRQTFAWSRIIGMRKPTGVVTGQSICVSCFIFFKVMRNSNQLNIQLRARRRFSQHAFATIKYSNCLLSWLPSRKTLWKKILWILLFLPFNHTSNYLPPWQSLWSGDDESSNSQRFVSRKWVGPSFRNSLFDSSSWW